MPEKLMMVGGMDKLVCPCGLKQRAMQLKIIKFEPDHLKGFMLRGYTRSPVEALPGLKERIDQLAGSNCHAYTMMAGDDIAGCAGIYEVWRGVGEAWLMASELVEKYPLFFHRTVKHMLNSIQRFYGLHRIQLTVRADSPFKYYEWVQVLGFRYEGTLKMFGPDKADHYRYAKVTTE